VASTLSARFFSSSFETMQYDGCLKLSVFSKEGESLMVKQHTFIVDSSIAIVFMPVFPICNCLQFQTFKPTIAQISPVCALSTSGIETLKT
jgi:hypothetical protein